MPLERILALAATSVLLTALSATAGDIKFKCGNHNPADIADSLEEAQKLSKDKNCTNWNVFAATGQLSEQERRVWTARLEKLNNDVFLPFGGRAEFFARLNLTSEQRTQLEAAAAAYQRAGHSEASAAKFTGDAKRILGQEQWAKFRAEFKDQKDKTKG
jgi:nanoRNase/pAp phosphatase (c-di-AMP/oligoRNAs hydrolase)